jgi:outer membrane protein TolC
MKALLGAMFLACTVNTQAQASRDTLSLTLDRAIEIALSDNPTMKVADQEVQLKQVANKEAWQSLLPEASISASVDHTIKASTLKLGGQSFKMGQDNSNTSNAGLSISLPLFAPAVYRTMSITRKDIELALEQARSSRISLINQVTKAYFQLLLSQDTHDVMLKSYKLAEDNFNIVNAKFSQGSVSEFDKISAEVQMRSTKPSVVSSANAITLAQLQLKVLMGITEDVAIVIADNLANYENSMFSDAINSAPLSIENNSTMKQFEMNRNLLQQNIKLARTNFLPTLGLSFSYQYQSLYNDDLNFFNYDWANSSSVAVSLSIPLYRASNFTKMKTARIQLAQLEWNRIDTERNLNTQAQSYRNNMTASTEQVVSNKENVLQAEKAVQIASKRYEVGRGTVLELNSSQVSLTEAQLTYNQSIYDYLTAKADLEQVLGIDKADK